MGTCCSVRTSSPTPPASLSAVELGALYDDGSAVPSAYSIPAALQHFHSTFPPCTRASLEKQREEFWHTRVEGDPQVWLVLRAACQAEDEGTREVMMESAGLQRWSIEKEGEVFTYDAKGQKYEVPFYCIYTPATLITAEAEEATGGVHVSSPQPLPSPLDSKEDDPSSSPIDHSHVNGSPASSKAVKFKIRFSDGMAADLPLDLPCGTEVRELKVMVKEMRGIGEERQMYLLHGQRWNHGTLLDMGLKKEMILQCFVKQEERTE